MQRAGRLLRAGAFVACGVLPGAAWSEELVKPNVFIAATGGTIAGTQANVEQHGYTAGQLGVALLIAAVP
jgi:L-asparaginase